MDAKLVGKGPDYAARVGWDGFHWRITLRYDTREMTTLFSMGKAHAYTAQHKADSRDAFVEDAGFNDGTNLYAKAPTVEAVLYSLQSDANIPDSFDHFCSEFGYDTDSRKAEITHNACLHSRREVLRLFQNAYDDFLNTNWEE
jgi:hypothetical protein